MERPCKFRSQHIHFVGVSGIGMSALAGVLARRGIVVSGSDLTESDAFRQVVREGARCTIGHDPRNVEGADLVVYSPAVPLNNCELEEARRRGLRIIPRAQLLSELADDFDIVGVSGTHGKSTTSWLVGHLLLDGGLDPTIMVGAHVHELGSNFRTGNGRYLVAEIDESDGIFAGLRSTLAVVTNIDRDHLDHYRNLGDIKRHFLRFIENTSPELGAIVCADDKAAMAVTEKATRPVLTYGLGVGELQGRVREINGAGSTFDVEWRREPLGTFTIHLLGRHNILNALATVGVGVRLGIPMDTVQRCLAVHRSVDRRQSLRYEVAGVSLWDDYGHHPAEIRATLSALRPAVSGRLFVVFQPHRYSRTLHLHKEFARCFALSDHLIITDIYAACEAPIDGVDSRLIADLARQHYTFPVEMVGAKEFVPALLAQQVQPGDAVVFQGAGDVCSLAQATAQCLTERVAPMGERNVG